MNYLTALAVVGVFGGICIKIGVDAQYNLSIKNLREVLVALEEENPEAYQAFIDTADKVSMYRKFSQKY